MSNPGPVPSASRIDVLDILRGIAILLIFPFNIPLMGSTNHYLSGDLRLLGWNPADRVCYTVLSLLFGTNGGTTRGLLQLLFGAGAVLLLEPALRPTWSSGASTQAVLLYLRRNLWLACFGLFDIFILLWYGDILLAYSLAALLLYPFRRWRPHALLLLLGLGLTGATLLGWGTYQTEAVLHKQVQAAETKQAAGLALSTTDRQALEQGELEQRPYHLPPALLAQERQERLGALPTYVRQMHSRWLEYELPRPFPLSIVESFFTMLAGMALFRLRITQGEKSASFYCRLACVCYALSLPVFAFGLWKQTRFQAGPNVAIVGVPVARTLLSIGHLAFINLLAKTTLGMRLLAPFKAAGRTAFSLYLTQNLLGMWILFPGFALGLWGRFHWFGLAVIAFAVIAAQLTLANLWLRNFAVGPFEWLWRSLAYRRVQPFRHRRALPAPIGV